MLVYLQQHTWRLRCRRRGTVALGLPAGSRSVPAAGLPTAIFVMAMTLDNALHQLQAFVQPHVQHVITQTFEQADEEFLMTRAILPSICFVKRFAFSGGDEVEQIMTKPNVSR